VLEANVVLDELDRADEAMRRRARTET